MPSERAKTESKLPGSLAEDLLIALLPTAVFTAALVLTLVGAWPRHFSDPRVRSVLGDPTYSGFSGPLVIRASPDFLPDGGGSTAELDIDLPDGQSFRACVDLVVNPKSPEEFLCLRFWHNSRNHRALVHDAAIELVDSEGSRFALHPDVVRPNIYTFFVDSDQVFEHLRFNDPAYYLSLKMPFELAGPRVIRVPKFTLYVGPNKRMGDTPAHGLAMLVLWAALLGAPLLALRLYVRMYRRWRRRARSTEDRDPTGKVRPNPGVEVDRDA